MSNSGAYIGVPNGVVFCIDDPIRHGVFQGRIFHGYSPEAVRIPSFDLFVQVLDDLYDELQFPRASDRRRSFNPQERAPQMRETRKERVMSDHELLTKHGEIGTFIIRVQKRQNSTWQGRITWVEKDKTAHFRSTLEMIKLMESGLASENPQLLEEEDPTWG